MVVQVRNLMSTTEKVASACQRCHSAAQLRPCAKDLRKMLDHRFKTCGLGFLAEECAQDVWLAAVQSAFGAGVARRWAHWHIATAAGLVASAWMSVFVDDHDGAAKCLQAALKELDEADTGIGADNTCASMRVR